MATFYVATTGNDSWTGVNPTNVPAGTGPWQTFAKWSTAPNGDIPNPTILVFRGGVYGSLGTLTGKNFTIRNYPDENVQFTDTNAGRSAMMTWTNWTSGGVSTQGTGTITFGPARTPLNLTDGTWVDCALLLNGCQNLLIDGGTKASPRIIFSSFSDQGIRLTKNGGFGSGTPCQFITIRGCEFTKNAAGIFFNNPGTPVAQGRISDPVPNGPGVVIEDCWFHHNDRMGAQNTGGGDTGAIGVGYERAWGTPANPMILRNSWFHDNSAPDNFPGGYGEDGGAFETFGAGYLHVYDNVCWNNAGGFETGTGTGATTNSPLSSNLHVYRNVFYGKSNNITPIPPAGVHSSPFILLRDYNDGTLDHNTFHMQNLSPAQPSYILSMYLSGGYAGEIKRVKIRNNICVQDTAKVIWFLNNQPGGADAPVIQNNIYLRPGPSANVIADYPAISPGWRTFAEWQALGYDVNGKNLDPLWTNGPGHVYTLQTTSPAKNAGIVIPGRNDGYQGTAPDMGAFEFVEGAPPATVYAQDSYSRTVVDGLGTAEIGGAYTTAQGVAGDYDVNGANMTVSVAVNSGREVRLTAVSAMNVRGSGRVRIDRLLTGAGGVSASQFVRRSSDSLQSYRFAIKFLVTGAGLQMYAARRSGAGEILIGSAVTPAALATYTANGWIRYKYECVNETAGVASLRMRVWADGAAEPGTWDVNTTDATASNQITGSLQPAFHYADATLTSGTMLMGWDDLSLTSVGAAIQDGAASITGIGTKTGAATIVRGATATLSGLATVSAAGRVTRSAAASVTGAATVAGAGQRVAQGAATATGVASTSGAGSRLLMAASAISGQATVSAVPLVTLSGVASLAGVASVSGTGRATLSGVASLTGVATTNATGSRVREGAAAIIGMATVVPAGSIYINGAASILGFATVDADDTPVTRNGAASIVGEAIAAGVGARTVSGAAAINGIATMFGAAAGTVSGDVALVATAQASATASLTASASADVTATAQVSATGQRILSGDASLVATAQVTADGQLNVDTGASVTGTAAIQGLASLYIQGFATIASNASVAGTGELVIEGAASITATAQATAAAERIVDAAASITGVASILARNYQLPGGVRVAVVAATASVTDEV